MLRSLPAMHHPDLLIGPEHNSDAGIYRLRPDLAIVLTTDFFPPLVDDPYTFGQIAATNSLSDCYAMGGAPAACLNIVGFPDKELPIEVLNAILAGGASKVAEAGAVIVGGHSLRDAEVKYGLAVTGTVHPDRFFTNRTARPGDRLILTKPIGSGTMCNAAKSGKIPPEDMAETIAVMTQLNAVAAAVARQVAAHAVTDITGFGLIGHAGEMAEASGVTIELSAGAVPLIRQARELAAAGVVTRTWKTNLENLGEAFRSEGVAEELLKLLADAQTSGGLLLAVVPERADEAMRILKQAGLSGVAEIGRVSARRDTSVLLQL